MRWLFGEFLQYLSLKCECSCHNLIGKMKLIQQILVHLFSENESKSSYLSRCLWQYWRIKLKSLHLLSFWIESIWLRLQNFSVLQVSRNSSDISSQYFFHNLRRNLQSHPYHLNTTQKSLRFGSLSAKWSYTRLLDIHQINWDSCMFPHMWVFYDWMNRRLIQRT